MLKETTFKIKAFVPFLIAILTFISVSIFYFSPVLKGKQIFQSDIQQFRGMSNEIKDFREKMMQNLIGQMRLLEECLPTNSVPYIQTTSLRN